MKASEKWQGFNVMIYKVKMRYKADLDNKKLYYPSYIYHFCNNTITLYIETFYAKSSFKDAVPWKQVAISIYQIDKFVTVIYIWNKIDMFSYILNYIVKILLNPYSNFIKHPSAMYCIKIHSVDNLVQWIFKLSLSSLSNSSTLLTIVA